ncbi:helix-turn-helix domain-containing protein [Treponema pectinovorum]|uniref:helix-turn-helix domain-containing protein n=1 Tax=Treponema pectinovorum TaxID=164 RepID=UPI003D902B72
MKNDCSGKRIGFVLQSIHFGSSLKLWQKLTNYVSRKSGSFFIFPGSHLNNPISRNPRNEIYKLVNSENLDGLISWASSIGNGISQEELTAFHRKFGTLPFVTIGQKILNNPDVSFDAYTGMKALTEHFIKVHGAKRLAFIRGPKNHKASEDRFKGYYDALEEFGLVNEKLITDCIPWFEGEKGVRQLYEERKLIPGKDFDTLLTASDMMTLIAAEFFEKHGYRVPKDYICGGFNDSSESHIYSTSFSTVHMPMERLGILAYEKLFKVLEGQIDVQDEILPAYPVIRESCGCNSLKQLQNFYDSKIRIKNRDQLLEEICKIFKASEDYKHKVFEPLIDALFENNQSEFFQLLDESLISYFKDEGELSYIFAVLKLLRNSTCLPEEYATKIINTVNLMIPKVLNRVCANKFYKNEKTITNISAVKTALLSAHNLSTLIKTLSEYLPQMGIRNSTLVLYENEEISKYVGGFNDAGELRFEEILFPSKLIVPSKFAKEFEYGVYIVQPLFMANKSLGYLITSYTDCDGNIYEDLRTAVSNAIQSIFLFEEINKARQLAEQAEFAKTEFFANVGSDLCDPLKDLFAKVTQMEVNTEKGILEKDILSEQLIFLKSQIQSQLKKTETLIELTRSQVDDLPMDKKLFDIRQVLPGSVVASLNHEYPLLYGDAERLKKAVLTLYGEGEGSINIFTEVEGLKIIIKSRRLDWQKPELLLAEKIILLQYGLLNKIDEYTTIITMPWPNLAGLPPVKNEELPVKILNLSARIPNVNLFDLEMENITNAKENEQKVMLYWQPDNAPIDERVKVYGLRHNDKMFRAPILCYSHELINHNFVEMLEAQVRTKKSSPVLFVNTKHTRYGTWATDDNSVSIQSMAEFEDILNEIIPSLIVFETIDEESIKRIRQNSKTVLVPIIVLPDSIFSEQDVDLLCSHPRIILCNRGAAESEQFNTRIHEILVGDEILPPHTGALVKKAILYLNKNASQQIVRWKLADTVHVSEDYLTRIFHKEIGLSLWEYLNRFRIYLATKMLLETNDTIYEIAENCGFQDQAYFCRVFKKIYGVPPGKIRTKQ